MSDQAAAWRVDQSMSSLACVVHGLKHGA
jgi:hypothetical protein